VIIWEDGEYRNTTERDGEPVPMAEALADGYASFFLEGHKLRGEWSLRRFSGEGREDNWLLTKRRDEHADPTADPVRDRPESVVSGRTIEQVAEGE
jgi:hypothetical protein